MTKQHQPRHCLPIKPDRPQVNWAQHFLLSKRILKPTTSKVVFNMFFRAGSLTEIFFFGWGEALCFESDIGILMSVGYREWYLAVVVRLDCTRRKEAVPGVPGRWLIWTTYCRQGTAQYSHNQFYWKIFQKIISSEEKCEYIEPCSQEYLEIDLRGQHVISSVVVQGRYANGLGQEYAEYFVMMYWRERGEAGAWVEYREGNNRLLPANNNTYQAVETRLRGGRVLTSKVRWEPKYFPR